MPKSPFIHLFKHKGYNFVLDLHTNRIFSLQPAEAQVLERWVDGTELAEISKEFPNEVAEIEHLRAHGLFCCEQPLSLAFGIGWEEICHNILHKRSITIIEITQQCNLRCTYCTFGGGFRDRRTHSSTRMSHELLMRSIEAAFEHGTDLDEIFITFYGGEPLSSFDLLRTGASFALKMASGKKIGFSLTTNATHIDEPKARFLRDSGFSVLVSLDGTKDLHDHFRVYPDGRGSYADTVRGLKTLLDVYPSESHHKIGLNMVVPSATWITYIEKLWDEEPWIPRTIRARASIVDPPAGFEFPEVPLGATLPTMEQEWLACLTKPSSARTTLAREIYDGSLARLHQRPIFFTDERSFFPNGCCIPGVRKIYVQADGTYQLCERVHGIPSIGSVQQGVDLKRIREIIDEYNTLSFKDCKDCWAVSTCDLCFADAYQNGGFSLEKKREACVRVKRSLSSNLSLYGWISQEYPEKLVEWEKFKIQ